ncbi:glycosyltransferase [Trinickia caryophylli]|uniref:Glycosyltransferase involved in cell wall bisynthesis n=1 Tax=Trinickia caryophylli TaxID=28094 RepID=A0A1X7CGB1_TRICW|nr:glycosyltransferase [Trinickia caryophylli]TRX19852.1 glycosyltransferase family 4 protein [Trinickia caryophylli]WQE12815.1 glycosyltransferase [Trinickia caryophylli]GLU30534.1 hypothetical protein Busp01_03760 [Trinickia caryophylli]SME96048.1 Glycosyltransferase involved in cell wall bisynthesis [Trinickia caryophylli]
MANATLSPAAGHGAATIDAAARATPAASAAAQTVLLIEPNFSGHRWRYAQWAAEAFVEAGHACVLVTESRNEDHRLARRIAAAGRSDLEIAFVDPPAPSGGVFAALDRIPYWRYHRYFRHAYRLVTEFAPVSLVAVPYVDYFLYAVPFLGSPFGSTPWIGVTMRSSFHHRSVGVKAPDRRIVNAVKACLFRQAVRAPGVRALLSIDPTLPEWSARALGARAASVRYLADPFPDARADDPARARARLGLPPGRYLLVYGAITDRKGIRELVAALECMDEAPTLVVAGEQDAQIREFLGVHAGRLTPAPVVMDSFVTNETELDLFSACDAVWLGYKGHYGMSGVLVQAYRFRRPVIATAEGLIGWFCRDGSLGPVIDDLSPESIARAIDRALSLPLPVPVPHGTAAGAYDESTQHECLLERNTLEQFKRTLREAMGTAEPRQPSIA